MERGTETLFHYTCLPSLALILRNRTIRFTRLDRVDDPQEMRTADSRNLAKFRFVSCWTDSAEESIPMWREYAGVESGVRIELPADPFKLYSLEDGDLSRLGMVRFDPSVDMGAKCLRLPISELWDKGLFVQEATCPVEVLHKVIYTDDPDKLFPKVIESAPEGGVSARIGAVGVAKATAWAYQREWRYILTILPFDLRGALEVRQVAMGRVMEAVLDLREPELPAHFDLAISDEAFASMHITASPSMGEGCRTILEALVDRYNPSASIVDSALEL